MTSTLLKVEGLVSGYPGMEIVHDISFGVGAGQFACILGANGCGKSTTLKTILGLLKPKAGSVLVNSEDTVPMSEGQRAKLFAYIPQAHTPPFPFTVHDVVLMGRTPHLGAPGQSGKEDEAIAWECIERMGIADIADRPYTQLSGGQQQLALIARSLAQQPKVMIMDEPTASLDFGNQQLVLRQMSKLTQGGTSVLMVTHDPSHALLCADHVIIMEKGCVIAEDEPERVITTEMLRRIYGAEVEVADVATASGTHRACIQSL